MGVAIAPSWEFRVARLALGLVLGAWLNALAPAAQAETLIWAGSPYAPMAIRGGALNQQGYVDRMLNEVLRPRLPQYQHVVWDVSPNRLERELLRPGQAVCSIAISKTPSRAERYAYTEPLFRFLPSGLVLRRLDPFTPHDDGARTPLSLRAVFAQGLRLGLVGFRAQGEPVDALLAEHPERIQRFHLATANQSVLAMLARGHAVDAVLAYEFELTYFTSQQPELGQRLVWWPLAELGGTQLSYVACSRNPEGQQAAAAIDALLSQAALRERIQLLYEAWLDEPSRQQLRSMQVRMGAQFWRE